jgi:hypothetical protein
VVGIVPAMTAITTARLTPDPQRFPPGTSVSAYRGSAWSSSDRSVAPTGAADVGPVAVAADGTLTFAGLTDQTTYFAWAAGSGAPVRFTTRHDYVDDLAVPAVRVGDDNTFTGANTFNGVVQARSYATFGNPGSLADKRTPWKSSQTMLASATGNDHVAHLMQTIVAGDWTADGGTDPGFVWGLNVYMATDQAAGAANGVNTFYGALLEAAVRAPAGTTITTVIGVQAEASFAQAAAAASVTNMTSMYVKNPRRKDGALAGSVTGSVYGLRVAKVIAADVGTPAGAYSVMVEGGSTVLNGIVQVLSDDAAQTPLLVKNANGSAQPALLVQSFGGTNLLSVSSAGAVTAPSAVTAYNGGGANLTSLLAYNAAAPDPIGAGAGNRGSITVNGDTRMYRVAAGVWGFPDGHKLAAGATNGLMIGTATTEKTGLWGAAPITRPTVTGSKASGAALVSLLAALVSWGAITDTTTA